MYDLFVERLSNIREAYIEHINHMCIREKNQSDMRAEERDFFLQKNKQTNEEIVFLRSEIATLQGRLAQSEEQKESLFVHSYVEEVFGRALQTYYEAQEKMRSEIMEQHEHSRKALERRIERKERVGLEEGNEVQMRMRCEEDLNRRVVEHLEARVSEMMAELEYYRDKFELKKKALKEKNVSSSPQ